MARSFRPLVAVFSFAFLGAMIGAVARFASLMYMIKEAGEDLGSVSAKVLVIDIMQHAHVLYGACAGALLGLVIILVDFVGFRRRDRYTPKERDVALPGADEAIKDRKARSAEAYLAERRRRNDGGGAET